jgi:hypothetical protein
MAKRLGMEQRKKCRGTMKWHDDGNAFMCAACGHVVRRTRMNPMPDTTHLAPVRAALAARDRKESP